MAQRECFVKHMVSLYYIKTKQGNKVFIAKSMLFP